MVADVFVGFYYDSQKEKELLRASRSAISAAANQYQEGFLLGLPKEPKILTTLSTATFPRGSKRLLFRKEEKKTDKGEILYLPFVNFHLLKNPMFAWGLYHRLCRIVDAQPYTVVYVYSLNTVFERVMARLKRKFGQKVHYCLIVPDLPGKYGIVRRGIKGLKDRLEAKPKMELATWADSFIFLTEAMKTLFPSKPSGVLEGFLPQSQFDYQQKRIPKTVLYTGSLNREFGLDTLLEAFCAIPDPDAQLWICGAGDMEVAVKAAAARDTRILFKGFLSKAGISSLQTRCDVLINPRPAKGEYTQYSFPSKTMEYLLSGSKVVMYRLPGIGAEYYRYIRTIDADGPQAMAAALQKAWADVEFYEKRSGEQINWISHEKQAHRCVCRALQEIGLAAAE